MHRFVDIEDWPLNKGQGKKIISCSNSIKVIKHDDKVKKIQWSVVQPICTCFFCINTNTISPISLKKNNSFWGQGQGQIQGWIFWS